MHVCRYYHFYYYCYCYCGSIIIDASGIYIAPISVDVERRCAYYEMQSIKL